MLAKQLVTIDKKYIETEESQNVVKKYCLSEQDDNRVDIVPNVRYIYALIKKQTYFVKYHNEK